jgi:peptidoglycan/xylan/chitin deacetylase (PgdA/CDA1 family)
MGGRWISRLKNSSRRDKAFLVVFVINLCFVAAFGLQLGETISLKLNTYMAISPLTGDGAIRGGNPDVSAAAITCNVDWGEDQIPLMLEVFKEKDVRVTFFVSGKWAQNNAELLRRMQMAGHEIGNHGHGHKLPTTISMEKNKAEILNAEAALQSVTGIKPDLFAPPSGDYDINTVALCEDLGYRLILWTADTIDWKEGSTAAIIKERVLQKDLRGSIILMHPKPETVKALPSLLDEIKARGIRLVTVSELIGL